MIFKIIVYSYYPGNDGTKLGIEKEYNKEISREQIDYFLKNNQFTIKEKYPGIEKISIDFEKKIIYLDFNSIDNGQKFISSNFGN